MVAHDLGWQLFQEVLDSKTLQYVFFCMEKMFGSEFKNLTEISKIAAQDQIWRPKFKIGDCFME